MGRLLNNVLKRQFSQVRVKKYTVIKLLQFILIYLQVNVMMKKKDEKLNAA